MSIEHNDDICVSRPVSFIRPLQALPTGSIPHEFSDLAPVGGELLHRLLVSNVLKSVVQSQQILFL